LYGERGLWIRPRAMFEETIEVNGERVQRFTLVEAAAPDNSFTR